MIEQYCSGVSVVRLAELFGVHKTTVSGHLRRAGVKVRGSQRSLSAQQEAEAARLYVEEGLTLADLGERFSVSPSTIRDVLSRSGVQVRKRSRPSAM
jgi:transposase-like protein